LERGYSITLDASSGAVVTAAAQAPPGTRLRTLLHDGEVESEVQAGDTSPGKGSTA
jgi:exonuclease VII large subunit